MTTIETGVFLDNSAGNYTPERIIERLGDLAADIGVTVPEYEFSALRYCEDEVEDAEYYRALSELEDEYAGEINGGLEEHGLVFRLHPEEYIYMILTPEQNEELGD